MATKIPKSQNVVDHPRNIRHVACHGGARPPLKWVIGSPGELWGKFKMAANFRI